MKKIGFTCLLLIFMISLLHQSSAKTTLSANKALNALGNSQFKEAKELAQEVIKNDSLHSQAHVIIALIDYIDLMHDFSTDFRTFISALDRQGVLNKRYVRWSLEQTDERLSQVDKILSIASKDNQFSLELCIADLKIDWNRNGRIDERDQKMLEIEVDANGKYYPENDPRRRPTFRFDVGDIFWAQAMISFQRSVINLLLAYSFPDIAELEQTFKKSKKITIYLKDKKYVSNAKKLFLKGLQYADQARESYLAETDDDREWLPNPRQKNHPLPLPVDQKLYDTWKGIIQDAQLLVNGSEGLDVEEIAQLGDHKWANPPKGFINVGKLFEEPGDIVIDIAHIESFDDKRLKVEQVLTDIFGDKYVRKMKKSQLTSRFARMKKEVQRGEESFERKLRYLFWLN